MITALALAVLAGDIKYDYPCIDVDLARIDVSVVWSNATVQEYGQQALLASTQDMIDYANANVEAPYTFVVQNYGGIHYQEHCEPTCNPGLPPPASCTFDVYGLKRWLAHESDGHLDYVVRGDIILGYVFCDTGQVGSSTVTQCEVGIPHVGGVNQGGMNIRNLWNGYDDEAIGDSLVLMAESGSWDVVNRQAATVCPEDHDWDGQVSTSDLLIALGYGTTADILAVYASWGPCEPSQPVMERTNHAGVSPSVRSMALPASGGPVPRLAPVPSRIWQGPVAHPVAGLPCYFYDYDSDGWVDGMDFFYAVKVGEDITGAWVLGWLAAYGACP